MEKLHVSAITAIISFDNFLAKRVFYNMPKPRGDVEISSLTRKLSKPEDGRYRPKHVVFPLLINTII